MYWITKYSRYCIELITLSVLLLKNEENTHQPIIVNRTILQSMSTNSIIVCKWPKPLRFKYYRNVLPGFLITSCESCFKVPFILNINY